MKKFIAFIFSALCFFSSYVCAAQLSHPLSAKVIHTEWFEIVYEPAHENTANRLSTFADQVYLDANHALGVEPRDHLSIIVSGETQSMNAYWSSFPFDHLVIYDAAPDSWDLASYDDTLRSVLYHELTHHITLTMTDPDSIRVRQLLDRVLCLGSALNAPRGFSEGATVSKESSGQKGRLQNGYVLHTLMQAKSEGKALRWEEMSGTRDTMGIGSWSYYMGGAFARYLQETYGEEKYTKFWQEASHLYVSMTYGVFKEVYGKSLTTVWSEFYNQIPDPVFTDASIEPLLKNQNELLSLDFLNPIGGYEPGVAVCDFSHQNIVFYPVKADGSYGHRRVWKQIDATVHGFSVSPDGTRFAVSCFAPDQDNRYRTQVYDRRTGFFVRSEIDDMRTCTFLTLPDNRYGLAGIKTKNYNSVLSVYTLKGKDPLFEKEFPINHELYAIAPGPDDTVTVLEKIHGQWNLGLYSLVSDTPLELVARCAFPETIIPRYLVRIPGTDNRYSLSVAGTTMDNGAAVVPGAFPRSAEVSIVHSDTGYSMECSFDQSNVSGGLYNPVMITPSRFAAISKKSEGMEIVQAELLPRTTIPLLPGTEYAEDVSTISDEKKVTRYHLLGYMNKGTFLPFEAHPYDQHIISQAPLISPGIGWITSDPAECFFTSIGAGYIPWLNQVTASVDFNGDTGMFHWGTFGQFYHTDYNGEIPELLSLLLKGGPKQPKNQFYNNLMVSTYWYWWDRNWTQSLVFFPQMVNNLTSKYTVINGQFQTQIRYLVKKGPSPYVQAGFSLNVIPYASYAKLWNTTNSAWMANLGLGASVYLPFVTVSASFMPPSSDNTTLAAGSADVILFSTEIQKRMIPGLYANRFAVKAGYDVDVRSPIESGDFFRFAKKAYTGGYKNAEVNHQLSLECYVVGSLPFGSLTESKAKVGAKLLYNPSNPKGKQVSGAVVFDFADR